MRAASLGHFTSGAVVHVAVLLAFAAAGMTVASRRIERLLLS